MELFGTYYHFRNAIVLLINEESIAGKVRVVMQPQAACFYCVQLLVLGIQRLLADAKQASSGTQAEPCETLT